MIEALLPRTGSTTGFIAVVGAGVGMLGLVLLLLGASR